MQNSLWHSKCEPIYCWINSFRFICNTFAVIIYRHKINEYCKQKWMIMAFKTITKHQMINVCWRQINRPKQKCVGICAVDVISSNFIKWVCVQLFSPNVPTRSCHLHIITPRALPTLAVCWLFDEFVSIWLGCGLLFHYITISSNVCQTVIVFPRHDKNDMLLYSCSHCNRAVHGILRRKIQSNTRVRHMTTVTYFCCFPSQIRKYKFYCSFLVAIWARDEYSLPTHVSARYANGNTKNGSLNCWTFNGS